MFQKQELYVSAKLKRPVGKTTATTPSFLLRIDPERFVRLCKTAVMLYRQHQMTVMNDQGTSSTETNSSDDVYSWLNTLTKQSHTMALDNFGCGMLRHLEEPRRILDTIMDFFIPLGPEERKKSATN